MTNFVYNKLNSNLIKYKDNGKRTIKLIKTFNLKNTLKRGRQDKQNWGYDETSVN